MLDRSSAIQHLSLIYQWAGTFPIWIKTPSCRISATTLAAYHRWRGLVYPRWYSSRTDCTYWTCRLSYLAFATPVHRDDLGWNAGRAFSKAKAKSALVIVGSSMGLWPEVDCSGGSVIMYEGMVLCTSTRHLGTGDHGQSLGRLRVLFQKRVVGMCWGPETFYRCMKLPTSKWRNSAFVSWMRRSWLLGLKVMMLAD